MGYKILDKINKPSDLKKLNIEELNRLSEEIRSFLLDNVSKTGGHLASNLGIVELTIALHKSFNTPKDKIIFDVGHQGYVHKILTGRKEGFKNLRMLDGMSGFLKRSESDHDGFDAGHSSTSISVGMGIAKARDLKGEDFEVISVIGDGSLSGGMAFEALNNIGQEKEKVIVILNDNYMSISENVGGLSKYLSRIRTNSTYFSIKNNTKKALKRVPLGEEMIRCVKRVKGTVKYFFVPGMLFEDLGFTYVGPIDGHDIEEMCNVLENAKNYDGPILIHVNTIKGKGFLPAEKNPGKYHGVSAFDKVTGKSLKEKPADFSKVFGEKLKEIVDTDKNVVAITAAMDTGTGLNIVKEAHPDRVYDVGIAEQHAVTMAGAMATEGIKPVFAVYSTFLQRAYDQMLHDVCLQNLPVLFAVDRAGIVGADGETHQGIFDISFMSHMPNMNVYSPKDKGELECMLELTLKNLDRPTAIRYPRGEAVDNGPMKGSIDKFFIEEKTGNDFTIIGVGNIFSNAKATFDLLTENGFSGELINPRKIIPIEDDLVGYINTKKLIITIEDNVFEGGFGQNILSKIEDKNNIINIAMPKVFAVHGSVDQIHEKYGMSPKQNAAKIIEALKKVK